MIPWLKVLNPAGSIDEMNMTIIMSPFVLQELLSNEAPMEPGKRTPLKSVLNKFLDWVQ